MSVRRVLYEVEEERVRQDAKWGQQNHGPGNWFLILMEEVGEAGTSAQERDWKNYRTELVQATAVLVAMIECLDRHVPGIINATNAERTGS